MRDFHQLVNEESLPPKRKKKISLSPFSFPVHSFPSIFLLALLLSHISSSHSGPSMVHSSFYSSLPFPSFIPIWKAPLYLHLLPTFFFSLSLSSFLLFHVLSLYASIPSRTHVTCPYPPSTFPPAIQVPLFSSLTLPHPPSEYIWAPFYHWP